MPEEGVAIHRFSKISSCAIRPLMVNNGPYGGMSQMVWTDALYLRDFTQFERLAAAKLLKLAVILHEVYGSIDMAHRALEAYDSTQGTDLAARYRNEILGATQLAGGQGA